MGLGCVAVVVALFAVATALLWERLTRLHTVVTLFDAEVIVQNFRSVGSLGFPSTDVVPRGPTARLLPSGESAPGALPKEFEWNGTSLILEDWLQQHWTTGLVVLRRDSVTEARLLHERYFRGNTRQSRCVSWSMCKSVISVLVGIAVDEGLIGDIETMTITDYVPELKGSGYDGVSLKNVLQMSSGIAFNEDYFDKLSDINMMGYTLALGWSMDGFVASLKARSHTPGTFNHYVSMDTQALAMVLRRATNMTLSEFLETRLWSTAGFESPATWALDNDRDRMELSFGVLGVTTRDWARFGWLMLNHGRSPATAEPVVSEEWVARSLAADSPHLMPGIANKQSDYPSFGYGLQWWLGPQPDDPNKVGTDFLAIGVYGQMVFVSPEHDIVIAKNGADPNYKDLQDNRDLGSGLSSHENLLETQGYAACRAIAKHLASGLIP